MLAGRPPTSTAEGDTEHDRTEDDVTEGAEDDPLEAEEDDDDGEEQDTMPAEPATAKGPGTNGTTPQPARGRKDLASVRVRIVALLRERGVSMHSRDIAKELGEEPQTVHGALKEARARGEARSTAAGKASSWRALPPRPARPTTTATNGALPPRDLEALARRALDLLGDRYRRGRGSRAGPLALELGESTDAVRSALQSAVARSEAHATRQGAAEIWHPGPAPASAQVTHGPTEAADDQVDDQGADRDGGDEDEDDGDDEDDDREDEDDEEPMMAHTTPAPTRGSARMNGAATAKPAKAPRPAAAPPARRNLAPIVERVVAALRANRAPMRSADLAAAIGETIEGTKSALRLLRDRGDVHASPSAGAKSAWSLGAAATATRAKAAGRVALAPASARQAHKQSKPKPVNLATPAASPATRRTSMRPAAAASLGDALPALALELLRADPDQLRDVVRVLDLLTTPTRQSPQGG
jgi:hypothetical protein